MTTYWILSHSKWTKSIIATFSSKPKISTLSSATVLGRDQVPSNDPHLTAKMCMFIVMRKDGTPFDTTSVSEEDILEICVTLGHAHPLGVIWHLATESVALFHMTEEMQWASCGAVKAMELWDEPVAVQVMAPSEHHIEAYIAVAGGDLSKLWSPPSKGEGDPHSPTGNPDLGGTTLCHLQAELGDLADQELQQLMEDLHLEITLCELHTSPAFLNQLVGENFQGVVILMGMTWRSPFQEGGWVPPRQPSPSPAPAWPGGGWAL